jgi:hypothetical protein
MINDLIGLSYERRARPSDGEGKSDCFMLVCEVRRRLGLYDYEDDFKWAYDEYDSGNLPIKRVIRWLFENGKRTTTKDDGNVAIILPRPGGEIAVGVAYDGGIVTVSRNGRSYWSPSFPSLKLFKMLPDIKQ